MKQDTNNNILYSIIITTFNRYELTCKAIDSAIEFIDKDWVCYEIIVVDDCSTDNSFLKLIDKYELLIMQGFVKIISMAINSGVVSARNNGAKIALGKWMLILDSDNELIKYNKVIFENFLSSSNYLCISFRCIDECGALIGPKFLQNELDLRQALNVGLCETFGVYDRKAFVKYFSAADVVSLRRFESLAYFRLLRDSKVFGVSNIVMRKYNFTSEDRLSSKIGLIRDANIMRKGHLILLTEFSKYMNLKRFVKGIMAIVYYSFVSFKFKK